MPTIIRRNIDERAGSDPRLSLAARGLYFAVMTTKGDSEKVKETCSEGVKPYLKELIAAGYAKLERGSLVFGKKEKPIETFTPSEGLKEWARAKEINVDFDEETERWRDHHLAKGSKITSLDASWRTWMRNAKKRSPPVQVTHLEDVTEKFKTQVYDRPRQLLTIQ